MNYKVITDKLNEYISDNKKNLFLLIGVIIIFIFLVIGNSSEKTESGSVETTTQPAVLSINEIQKETETELEELIRNVVHTDNVKVMVTLGSSGEYVYAENSRNENNGEKTLQDNEIVIYESEKGNDEGLIVSVKSPEILGVAVVCDGGNSSVVRAEITELVTSLFGIGADRVYVGSNVR